MSLSRKLDAAARLLASPTVKPGELEASVRRELHRLRESVLGRFKTEGGERVAGTPYRPSEAGISLERVLRHLGRVLAPAGLSTVELSPTDREEAFWRASKALAAAAAELREIDGETEAEPEVTDWRAEIDKRLKGQARALFNALTRRNHPVAFDTLRNTSGVWRSAEVTDEGIRVAIKRLNKALDAIPGCRVLVSISGDRVQVDGLRPRVK